MLHLGEHYLSLSKQNIDAQLGLVTTRAAAKRSKQAKQTYTVLDSGATSHLWSDKKQFETHSLKPMHGEVLVANGNTLNLCGVGKVGILSDVRYVKDLSINMVSVIQICSQHARKTKDSAYLVPTGIPRRHRKIAHKGSSGLYHIYDRWLHADKYEDSQIGLIAESKTSNKLLRAHERLGHASIRTILNGIKRGYIIGLNINPANISEKDIKNMPPCSTCAKSKIIRSSVPKAGNIKIQAQHPFDIISMDVAGPTRVASCQGYTYFLCIVDAYSNAVYSYGLIRRNDAATALEHFLTHEVGKIKLRVVRKIRSDRAPELLYSNEPMSEILSKHGVRFADATSPYSSCAENGKSERNWYSPVYFVNRNGKLDRFRPIGTAGNFLGFG